MTSVASDAASPHFAWVDGWFAWSFGAGAFFCWRPRYFSKDGDLSRSEGDFYRVRSDEMRRPPLKDWSFEACPLGRFTQVRFVRRLLLGLNKSISHNQPKEEPFSSLAGFPLVSKLRVCIRCIQVPSLTFCGDEEEEKACRCHGFCCKAP